MTDEMPRIGHSLPLKLLDDTAPGLLLVLEAASPDIWPFSRASGTSGRLGLVRGSLINENLLAEVMRTSTIFPM